MVRNKEALLQSLSRPRCSARVTESLAQTDVSFCRSKMLYILDNVKFCASMMCILIVNPQFNRMHPWCSWEGTVQSWQKVSHLLGREYRVVTRSFGQSALCS